MNSLLAETDRRMGGFSFRRLVASCFQTTTLLGCAAILAGHMSLSAFFDHQKARALEDAGIIARNLNTAFEQHVVRSIKNIDQMLQFARFEYERNPSAFSPEQFSKRDFFPRELAVQLAVIGPDGLMVSSSMASSGVVDLSDREHFRFHLDNPGDDLFISQPVLGRVSKAWTIQFTRRLRAPDGRFAGVLVASIDPYYLSRIYESIDIGAAGAITLWGYDGVIRARGGASSDFIGRSFGDQIASQFWSANSGLFETASVIDGVPRIISYRRVPGYPLVVTVSIGREEALAAYEGLRRSVQLMMWLVDAALVLLMGLGVAESYRLRGAREHLLAKSNMLDSTFANIHEGILLVDAQGMVFGVNNFALELLGLSPESVVLPTPYANMPLARRESGSSSATTQQIPLSGGRTIEVKTSFLPDGGFVKTINDISNRKLNQAALEEARDKAEAATRARTSFLATMSHEIRTPLSGVLSMVDLIAGTKLDPIQKRYIEITRDSATHLLQLIDDVLDVTKLDADQVAFEDIAFDLYRQIRSTLDIVSPRAVQKGLAVGCMVAPDVPRELRGDPGRLRQVLINLLGNAIKFTASGHVLLEVSRRTTVGGDRLRVRVEDTGIGIAASGLQTLFDEFSQIDSSISRRFGGTGLGLAISRKLVMRMGGSIEVESEPNVGSVFTVEIPLRAVHDAEPVVKEPAAMAIVVRSGFERSHLRRLLLRSVDLVEAFETLDAARVWIAEAGAQRRRILLLDAALAPEGGVSAYARDSGVECFLLCARQDLIIAENAPELGYAGVVQKPLFPDDLRGALQQKERGERALPTHVEQRPLLEGRLQGVRVLIAEDNPTNQFALSRMLETMGAQVTAAFNGREAVDQADLLTFDVVLMDVMMPELDGLAAARAIRAGGGPNAAKPIIALTASAFVEDREAALAAGMNAFATKPITAQLLLETIVACRRGEAAPPAPKEPPALAADPALDRKLLDQLREDLGAEHMHAALESFYRDLRKRIASLRSGERTADFLRKEAHALKGSAASFGFRRISAAAAQLEDAARRNEVERFEDLLAALLAEADAAPDLLAA